MRGETDTRGDAELVAAVMAGDREAFGPLLMRWQASVLRMCRRLLGPGQEAEDIAQEAAVQAFIGLRRLSDPARFGAWLHAIAVNLARMELRGRRRLLFLDDLPPGVCAVRGWSDPGSTPEDAWASREAHETVMAALDELAPATREAVIGFYVQGYSYSELATLLGAPVSAVRGRLYHGRRRLRRVLQPLAAELLTAATKRKDEPMGTVASDLIEARVAFVSRLDFSTDHVVMLEEQSGPRQLALEGIDAATAGVVHELLDRRQPLATTTHDLMHGLVKALSGRIEQVTIRRLPGDALFADVMLGRDGRRREVEAKPGDAVALALLAGAPIRVAAAVMDAAGFDPRDREQLQLREQRDIEQLRRRLADRQAPPPRSAIAAPPPPEPAVRQRLEETLERLRTDLGGWVALLMHESGTLVAWAGSGDPALMARYAQARADHDADLAHLLMHDVFPPDRVEAVVFASAGRLWRVEVGIAAREPEEQRDQFARRITQAATELEALVTAADGARNGNRADPAPECGSRPSA